MTFADLPGVDACLNGSSTLFLGAGYNQVKRGHWSSHLRFMLAPSVTSTLFLLWYVTDHCHLAFLLHRGPTRFVEPAWFRPIYLSVLLTHTLLACRNDTMLLAESVSVAPLHELARTDPKIRLINEHPGFLRGH